MKIEAKTRLLASNLVMKFRDHQGAYWIFTEVTRHGTDGLGNEVFSGLYSRAHPSVFVVSPQGSMIASSVNDKSCTFLSDASDKADYAVEHGLTNYWDSKNPWNVINCTIKGSQN